MPQTLTSPARRKLAALSLFVSVGLLGGAALAKAPTQAERDERFAARMEGMETRVHDKLAPALGLDKTTAARVADVLRQNAEKMRTAREAVRTERQALKALVEKGAREPELKAQLAKLEAAVKAMPDRRAVIDQLKPLLTVEQQAKLALAGPRLLGMGEGRVGRHHGHDGDHGDGEHHERGDRPERGEKK